jgi:hypothetical protein
VSRYIAFACVIARAGRYLLLAVLLRRYGSAVLDRDLKLVAVGGMLLLVAGVAVLWLL